MAEMVQNGKLAQIAFVPTGAGAAMPILPVEGYYNSGGHGGPQNGA